MTYMAGFLNTILCPLLAGGTVVLGDAFSAQHAPALWPAAMAGRADCLWLTPTMAALLARLSRDPAVAAWTRASLRAVFVGTAPLPVETSERFERVFGVPCLESYGLSELLFVSANARSGNRIGTVGTALPGVAVTAGAAADGDGQILVTTPFAMAGYLDPASGEPRAEPLPFPSGDLGRIGEDGRIRITGRIKDLVIRGGMNISARAIEEVLLAVPGILDAAVIGRPHQFWGEEPVAFVVAEGAAREAGHVLAACARHLVKDQLPSAITYLDALPRTSNGKILKSHLRRLLVPS